MRNICFFIISILSFTECFATEKNSDKQCMVYNEQSNKYFNACKQLDKACEVASKIKNEVVKDAIINEFESCKNCFYMDFLEKNYASMSDKALIFYENLDEVLADCDQEEIKIEIIDCTKKIAEQFGFS